MKVNGQFKVKLGLQPVVLYDEKTLAKVQYMVREHPIECQWWHRVDRILQNDLVIYFVYDLFIPPQYVGGADVESDPAMMQAMWQEVKKERKLKSLKDLNEYMVNASCWCHSHHKMGVTPSPTDDEQWKTQKELGKSGGQTSAQMMMILNKRHEVFTRVYDPELDIEFENVPVRIQQSEEFDEIDKIMKERFKPIPSATKTVKELEKVIKNNGHKPDCECIACSTADHADGCQCTECKKKVEEEAKQLPVKRGRGKGIL